MPGVRLLRGLAQSSAGKPLREQVPCCRDGFGRSRLPRAGPGAGDRAGDRARDRAGDRVGPQRVPQSPAVLPLLRWGGFRFSFAFLSPLSV